MTGFFAYPPEIRKVIYTTNAIESLNSSMRKILKVRRAFPNDEVATKLMYLAPQKHRQTLDTASEGLDEPTQSVCHYVRRSSTLP